VQRIRSRVSARQAPPNGVRAGTLAVASILVLLAGNTALGAGPAAPTNVPAVSNAAVDAAATTAVTPVDPIGTYSPNYSGSIPEQPSPVPGVTPPPETDPGHLQIPGVTLPTASSLAVDQVQLGSTTFDPGYTQVSFHLHLTLGSDFATRLDRSIRLWAPNNLRYLPDEPAVDPSLLLESGYELDGWVTYLLPTGLSGPAVIHVTIDPQALTEIVVPVVIGNAVPQPGGVFGPTSILNEATPAPTSMPSATAAAGN
jgi:hypothetical protein